MIVGIETGQPTFAVMGAGCGGTAMAGHLALAGYDVALYNRSRVRIASFQGRGRIELRGKIEGVGKLSYVGTDLGRAIAGRSVIMIVTTATGHRPLAQKMARHLRDGQMVLLNPGRTFGALEFRHVVRASGCAANIIVAEANTLIYVSRVLVPGTVIIRAVKKQVSVSGLCADDTSILLDRLGEAFPQFTPAGSFLETSLGNIGAMFHPTIALLNKDRILLKLPFDFYTEGVTRETARYLEQVDSERCAVAAALGVHPLSVTHWLSSRYGLELADIYNMLRSNPNYRSVKAPTTLDHRYLWEDVPMGLVPISDVASAVGVDTPAINRLINEASGILGRDFRRYGRTLDKLGLSRYCVKEELASIISGRTITSRCVHA